MKKNTTIAAIVLIGIISILLLSYYSNTLTGAVVLERDKITFGVDTFTMASAPVFVAEAKGFWKQENLDIEIRPFVSSRLALDALVGKSVEAATVVDVATTLAAFQQQNLKIITTISTSDRHVNVLARKDRGISKIQDLTSKRIAVSSGTSGEFVLSRFLEIYNISKSGVEIVSLNPPDMVAAITRGDTDAIVTWQPHVYNAQKILGDNAIIFTSKGIYNHPFNIVVREGSLDKQKEEQKKLLIGLKKAEKFMKENKKESIEITAKKLGIDTKVVESLWGGYSFKISIDQTLANSLESEGKWAKRAGIIKQDAKEPDYKSLIYDQYIKSLK